MRLLCFLLVATVVSGFTIPINPWSYKEGQRWIFFPDDEGRLHLVDLYQVEPENRYNAEKSVQFLLFTRDHPREVIKFGDDEALAATHYDHTKPVKMIAHGWNSKGSSSVNTLITDAFLNSEDANVIVIDWGKGAGAIYTSACSNAKQVGEFVAKFIEWLNRLGTPVDSFHLMGHSLGAHLVGIAGRSMTVGKLPYVTGMDPANPLWTSGGDRIRPSDAEYVEVIHTDIGELGIKDPVGHADFYPNKGDGQPGCFLSVSCSHSRSYELMADSIDHKGFMAQRCTDLRELLKGKCKNLEQVHMGGSKPKKVEGVFYLKTNKKKPFYLDPKL